jgi:superfamily II DNA or RNA helicase
MPADSHTLPLLPDDPGPPPPPADADQSVVWDALAFMQSSVTINRLTDLIQHSGQRTARGAGFHPQEVRRLMAELQGQGRVEMDHQGRWWAQPALAHARFCALVAEPVSRQRWWAAWQQHQHFSDGWRLEFYTDEALVGAVRVVVHAGGSADAWRRLCALCRAPSPDEPVLLAKALLMPFDEALWQRLDPELAWALTQALLALPAGDAETITPPFWRQLHRQSQPSAAVLHEPTRLALALRLLFEGQPAEARRVLDGLDDAQADATRAAATIAEGRYAEGVQAFEVAWKRRSAETGKRKLLFPAALTWCQALALLVQDQPAQWAAARKFVASEAGKRDADPYTFWGVWQEAIDQRLGDAPRQARSFRLQPREGWRLPGLEQLAHLLLAAWLGHRPTDAKALRALAEPLAQTFDASGQAWLAALTRCATALLLDEPPAAADAALPFPIAAPAERWREALNAIVALGSPGAAPASGTASADSRLLWTLRTDRSGRVRAVAVLEQKAGARGLGKPKPVTLASLLKRTDLPAHDAAVLRAVRKAAYGGRLLLDRQQAVLALLRHPHLAWHDAPEQPIALQEGLPRLEVLTRGDHLQFRLLDAIRDGDTPADDDDEDDDDHDDVDEDDFADRLPGPGGNDAPPLRVLADGPGQARLLRPTTAQLRVAELISQGWQVPTAARAEIDAALRVLGSHFQLASDVEAGHEVPASTVLHAELTPQRDGLQLALVAAPFGDFGPRPAPGQGRERATTVHQGVTLSTRRDLAAERTQARALTDALPWLDDTAHNWSVDEPEDALAVVEALQRLAPGIVTDWPKGKPFRVRPVTASQLTLAVRSQNAWLTLDGELALDGGEVLRLEKLLALVAEGRSRYVALGDGQFLALGDTLRQQLADLRALAQPLPGGKAGQNALTRLAPLAALAWAAQPDAPALGGDAAWQRRAQAWTAAQAQTFALPTSLQAELRDYQLAGWQWLMRLAASGFGAVLADDMGLGKTLQTLALLAARAAGGPALVVAPTSVCGNWLAEAARFTPGLRVQMYGDAAALGDAGANEISTDDATGAEEAAAAGDNPESTQPDAAAPDSARLAARRRQVQALGPGDVLVCSYGLLQGDDAVLAGLTWHTAVLDEAQAIKNAATRRARAALALSADFRLALTGTPVENRLAELWAIMAFANPGLLGSAEVFHQRFATPIERDGDAAASKRLRRLVAPFLLRRTKAEVLADLPARTEIVHEVVPGPRERALLEALRRQAEATVGEALAGGAPEGQAQMHLLAALTRLRRAACDPRLVAPELGLVGAKVQEFERLAQELVAGRHKALVFSQFTDFLALLRERLDAVGLRYQYLDGSTPAAQRTQRVAAFQAGEGDFFLISLKAGGFGLNLTMADYVIIADPWWNPAAEDQASGRAHRIGQQRPVTVYRLVTQGSIEDRIVALHHRKRALADGVLAGQDGGTAAPLDAQAMLALLRGGDEDTASPA